LLSCLGQLRVSFGGRRYVLWACAVCRLIGTDRDDGFLVSAAEIGELVADGRLSEPERAEAVGRLDPLRVRGPISVPPPPAYRLMPYCLDPGALVREDGRPYFGERSPELCRLIREIVGNPFRPRPVRPEWLTWAERTAPRIATAIYQDRAFDRLPILADALEDADCTDLHILGHLRGPGPHVLGCWALDLILGKGDSVR
jgi:hypothetical protein